MKRSRKYFILVICAIFMQGVQAQNTDSILTETAKKIAGAALTGQQGYGWLRELCDLGPRLSGSPNSIKAIQWAKEKMEQNGYDHVWLQPVLVPYWVRGNMEKAWVSKSETAKDRRLNIASLGGSIGTAGLQGQVLEVRSFDQLRSLADQATGKIIFFNRPFDNSKLQTFEAYGQAVNQRTQGAIEAAKVGGIAAIVRSVTSLSDNVPHVGLMRYEDGINKIPAVAVGVEDADFLSTLIRQEPDAEITMKLSCEIRPDTISYNVIGDLHGSEYPDEVILVGGHFDAWDKGHGVHDDGGGCIQSMEAPLLLKHTGLQPKRTLRCVLFIDEEQRQSGAHAFAAYVDTCSETHIAAIESDRGVFTPRGFSVDADTEIIQNLQKWLPVLRETGIDWIRKGGSGADIGQLKKIPLLIGFVPDMQRYFEVHHSANDVYETVHAREMQLGTAAVSLLIHLLSENGIPDNGASESP